MNTSVLRFVASLAGAVVASAQLPGAIVNISTRGTLAAGQRGLTTGFVIAGESPKNVLIRGVGPGLAAFGITNPAESVKVQVFDNAGAVVAENEGYQTAPDVVALAAGTARVGGFPLSEAGDSALLTTLKPGAYSVLASPGGNALPMGVALIEVYDADGPGASSVISNLSGRGMLGTGGNSLVVGFVVAGDAAHVLLIRGVGPELAAWGVDRPASSVPVRVFDPSGALVVSSESRPVVAAGEPVRAAAVSGAFALAGEGSSSTFALLPPGAYTMSIGTGTANAGDEVSLFEVYDAGSVVIE